MSEMHRTLGPMFADLKEAVRRVISNIEDEYWNHSFDEARDAAKTIEISAAESLWKYWQEQAGTDSSHDHCLQLIGVVAARTKLQEIRSQLWRAHAYEIIDESVYESKNQQINDIDEHLNKLKEVLEPLCKLQREYETFCKLHEIYSR